MLPRNLPNSDKVNCFVFGVSSSSLSLMAPPLPSSEEDDDDDDKEMTSSSSINDNDSIVLISTSSIAEYRRERDAGPVANGNNDMFTNSRPAPTSSEVPSTVHRRYDPYQIWSWREIYRYIDGSKQCDCHKCRMAMLNDDDNATSPDPI